MDCRDVGQWPSALYYIGTRKFGAEPRVLNLTRDLDTRREKFLPNCFTAKTKGRTGLIFWGSFFRTEKELFLFWPQNTPTKLTQ